jgi:hypothetical protein
VEANERNESSKTWKLIKKISGQEKRSTIKFKSSTGVVLTEREMLAEWRLYFENPRRSTPFSPRHALISTLTAVTSNVGKLKRQSTHSRTTRPLVLIKLSRPLLSSTAATSC